MIAKNALPDLSFRAVIVYNNRLRLTTVSYMYAYLFKEFILVDQVFACFLYSTLWWSN